MSGREIRKVAEISDSQYFKGLQNEADALNIILDGANELDG
jgi:hypothetical protein